MPPDRTPIFTLAERQRRVEGVRKGLETRGLDALIAFGSPDMPGAVTYLTGYVPVFETAWAVIMPSAHWLVIPRWEWTHTAGESWMDPADVRRAADGFGEVERLLSGLRRVGVAGLDHMPHYLAAALRPNEPASPYRSTTLLEDLRRRKSSEEVEAVRRAAAIADAGTLAFARGASVGRMTEIELASEIECAMRAAGLERFAFPIVLGTGPGSLDVTVQPTERLIEPGDMTLLDCACRQRGYCADMARGAVCDEPSKEQLAMLETVARMYEASLDALRVGTDVRDPHRRAIEVARDAGYEYLHETGHHIGCDIHEMPWIDEGPDEVFFDADSVVAIEPGLYYPDVGGARIENTILITERGPVELTTAPRVI